MQIRLSRYFRSTCAHSKNVFSFSSFYIITEFNEFPANVSFIHCARLIRILRSLINFDLVVCVLKSNLLLEYICKVSNLSTESTKSTYIFVTYNLTFRIQPSVGYNILWIYITALRLKRIYRYTHSSECIHIVPK